MIVEQAIIVSKSDSIEGAVRARVDRKGACDACQLKSGCGQKLLHDHASRKCMEFDLTSAHQAEVGDVVELGIPEKALIKASLLMYVVPLIFMIVGAVICNQWLTQREPFVILASVLSLFTGFAFVRTVVSHKREADYSPAFIKVLKSSSS